MDARRVHDGAMTGATGAASSDAFDLLLGGDDGTDYLHILTEINERETDQIQLEHAPAPMKNPSRERIKRELGFLRECVVELEQELEELRAQKRPRRPEESALVESAWKSAIAVEKSKRCETERENERLHRMLKHQLSVANELSLCLRSRASSHDQSYDESSIRITPRIISASLQSLIPRLFDDINRAYAVTDSVLASIPRWDELPNERVFEKSIKTRRAKDCDQLYIEMVDTAYRSQLYESVCHASWEALVQVYAANSRIIEIGPRTHDVVASRFKATGKTRRGTDKNLIVTHAAKKFVEPNRTVIVWRTWNSPAQHDSDTPMQALTDETGWLVLTKVPEGFPNRRAGTAFMHACNRIMPVWYDGEVPDASVRTQLSIGEFTNVVLSATEDDISCFEDAFMRLAIEDSTILATANGDRIQECDELTAEV